MRARIAGAALVLVLVGSLAADAAAQAPIAAPDLVRLRDGGLLRGTIAELVVGDHVSIVLVTGETRRVAAADFSFAGPTDELPRAAPPATGIPAAPTNDTEPVASAPPPNGPAQNTVPSGAPAAARGAQIRFRSAGGERIVIDAASESASPRYARVCTTPCTRAMPIGLYHVALTSSGLPRLSVEHLVPLEDGDLVEVDYETRTGTRVGGLVLVGLTGAVGIGVALAPLAIDERSRDRFIVPAIVAGLAIAALGTLVGLLMHGSDDAAHASVTHREDQDDDDDDDYDD